MNVPEQNKQPGTCDLDTLVATYAPLGALQRRSQRRRHAALAGGCAALAAAIAVVGYSYVSVLDGINALRPASTTDVTRDDIERLADDRAEFVARLTELERQIAGVQGQRHDLELQHGEIRRQSARVALLLEELDQDRQQAGAGQHHSARLDEELRAMAAQRDALAERWAQFEAQGELLAMEIMAVNAQRQELESQRRQIDQQQRELAELLDRAEGLYRRASGSIGAEPTPEATSTQADSDAYTYTYNSLVADANELITENGQLDQMRGGFSIGDGLDISFGFTQTGAINGVEQYNNNFSVNSVASGFDNVDMTNMGAVLIQNGPGNFVSPDVLDSMANSFGSIIQNSLDDQVISTTTIYDISLHNVPGTLQGLSGEQALMDSLGSYR